MYWINEFLDGKISIDECISASKKLTHNLIKYKLKMKLQILKPDFDIEKIKRIKNYFSEKDKTPFEHFAYEFLKILSNSLITIDLSELKKKSEERYPKSVYYSLDPERRAAYKQAIEDIKEMMK